MNESEHEPGQSETGYSDDLGRHQAELDAFWRELAQGRAPLPAALEIPAGRVARGEVTPPPSKSISHRYFNLALLTGRAITVERPLAAEDIALFARALEVCGLGVERGADWVRITPKVDLEQPAERTVECGNAGTMFRFLTATLSTLPGRWVLDGTPRLRERPIAPLIAALRALGAEIECLERVGHAPLRIRGGSLRGGRCQLDASSSSQYLSALLMAGLRAKEPIEIEVQALTSHPYIAITADAMRAFGFPLQPARAGRWRSEPMSLAAAARAPERVRVEADLSAAAYPAAAAAITGGQVSIRGIRADTAQGDRRLLEVLAEMGSHVRWLEDGVEVKGAASVGVDLDLSDIPDQVPTVAAVACFARSQSRIRNVAHLRVKESDRLAAIAVELSKAGFSATEQSDGLRITGLRNGVAVAPISIDAHDDHRIAMSLALVGLRRPGLSILEPTVVGKSYPTFWRDLASLLFPP
jgi:3-phosphoshikimate 1-carboxyvinyltransferase